MVWLRNEIYTLLGIDGKLHKTKPNYLGNSIYILKFGKKSSLALLKKIYYSDNLPYLSRKKLSYINFLKTHTERP